MKEKIQQFIVEGETIRKTEYHGNFEPGQIMLPYIGGPKYDTWMKKIKVFTAKNLQSYPLYSEIIDTCDNRNNYLGTTVYDNMMGYLKTLLEEDSHDIDIMPESIYNLLISGDDTAWESNSVILDLQRCIREYTEPQLIDKFSKLGKNEINEIKNFPCIFAYENSCEKDASIGYITDILVRPVGVKISFEKIEVLSAENLNKFKFELDIRDWELNRTHWAIKRVNLYKELLSIGIKLKAIKTNQYIDITKHFFDVSFTFAGESRNVVEQVTKELEKIIDKDFIFYDNNYISQLARPSLDILLQDIYRNRSKLIVVFLCEKYQEKQWCGLEFRVIRELIFEKDMTRIMYIRLDEGHVEGVLRTDGYLDGTKFTPQQLAGYINERLNLLL